MTIRFGPNQHQWTTDINGFYLKQLHLIFRNKVPRGLRALKSNHRGRYVVLNEPFCRWGEGEKAVFTVI